MDVARDSIIRTLEILERRRWLSTLLASGSLSLTLFWTQVQIGAVVSSMSREPGLARAG